MQDEILKMKTGVLRSDRFRFLVFPDAAIPGQPVCAALQASCGRRAGGGGLRLMDPELWEDTALLGS